MGALRRAWRRLLIILGIRRITPADGAPRPSHLVEVPDLDTGGAWRAKHRPQSPAKDPQEPYGSESSSRGDEHAWSGCTMSSGADAIAYESHFDGGTLAPWGGDLRHRQGDLEGGTDLYDLRDAWAEYGQTFNIRSGAGWGALVDAHEEGRAIVIQGTGEVPGAGDFDGGHACSIAPETRSSDGAWLFGDPLVTDWQWIAPGKIRSWAERWQSSIAFGTSRKPPAPAPAPEPPPVPAPCYSAEELAAAVATAEAECALELTLAGDELVGAWMAWLRAPRWTASDAWAVGAWADPSSDVELDLEDDADPCAPGTPAAWARGPAPYPVADALEALTTSPTWGLSDWRQSAWNG